MDINLTLLGEMITFGILVWFTMRYIWPPITKAISERQQKIADGLANAERAVHSLDLARHESIKILQTARSDANDLMDKAHQQVTRILEDGHSKAHHETERLHALAKTEIAQEKSNATYQLRQETAEIAVRLAEKILRQQMDATTQNRLMQRLVEDLK